MTSPRPSPTEEIAGGSTGASGSHLGEADVERLRAHVADLMPGVRRDLERLVRIPSISAPAGDPAEVRASAALVAELLTGAGLTDVAELRAGDGAPAVVGRRPARDGAATVMLYAHHDVQPAGDPAAWTTPAFEPTERDGRLFGRGAADDKAGIMAHVCALRALGDELGTGVTVFVEGEEEVGSPTFSQFLRENVDRLAADVIVVADSTNWRVGTPALTTSLRGLVEAHVTVSTLNQGIHSGMYGGPVPDAFQALVRTLDALWDGRGGIAVPGLVVADDPALDYAEPQLRADAGILDGVDLVGEGTITSRLWTRPSITIVGIDAPSVAAASNTLAGSVKVKLSMRVAPGQDTDTAFDALRDHLVASAPYGARVDVVPVEHGRPFAGATDGPVYDAARWAMNAAWGVEPVHMGVGGSIPFIAELGEVYPEAAVLVTGVEDPDARAHGPDESLHLGEFERVCLAETLLLAALSRR
jgi:acetylornithine deacetylase/succinyl-diaminopimelate desuccinylase-like protein